MQLFHGKEASQALGHGALVFNLGFYCVVIVLYIEQGLVIHSTEEYVGRNRWINEVYSVLKLSFDISSSLQPKRQKQILNVNVMFLINF